MVVVVKVSHSNTFPVCVAVDDDVAIKHLRGRFRNLLVDQTITNREGWL